MSSVAVALSPSPFARAPEYLVAPSGTTVRAMLLEAVRTGKLALDDLARATVYVDGAAIPRDQALGLVLAEGQVVNIAVEPLGGGGGRKDPLQIILQIAVIAVAAWVGGPAGAGLGLKSAFWRTVASAATLTLGNMALAALFAPDTNSQAKANDRYALQSAQNQFRPWGSFPLALGEVVVAPDLAVKTYTRTVGDESWINGILALHHGPCEVSDLKIGDTLASSMGAGEAQFAYHLTPGPRTFSIYPNDTDQVDFQEELQATEYGATPLVRQASAEGERFEFDFFLPMGLHFAKDDGRILSASVSVGVERRQIDENGAPIGSWTNATTVALSSTTRDPWRITRAVSLPMGRYEFRFTRSLKPDNSTKRRDAIYLTAIRSVAFRKPVRDETLSLIEFSIRATALNQGALAPITCRITPKVPTWTGGAWGAPVASSNPAALVRWLMTGPAPAKPLAPPQADTRLRTWSALCDAYDWKAHIYLTESRQQDAVLAMLGQAGRAGLFWDGTQLAATPWVEKPAPRQLFAGENLADHRWSIAYPEPVHALRVEFANLDQDGEPDELFVYADGYAAEADPEDGLQAATLIEALRLEGQNTPERAYRDGRWELGRRLHQRRIDTWSCGLEHLVSSYGDRVRLAYGRVDGGIGARVRCRRWGSGETAGKVIGLRLDQPVEMVEGQAYALDLRLVSGVVASVPIVTTPGVVREVVFATPREPDSSPAAGGRVAFGVETRVSEDVEIIGVEPGEGLTARLTGIRYVAPLLMAGETGPIPPLPNRLSRDRAMDPPAPSLLGPPQIEPNGVRISWSMPPWRGSPITGYACRWRALPEEGQAVSWTPLPDPGAGAGEIITPPMAEVPAGDADRTRIQVEIRAMTASGRVSPPLTVTVVEPALPPPADDDWTVEPRTPGTGGVVQPGLTVSGTVSNDRVAEVIVEYGLAPEEVLTGPDDPPLEEQIAWSPWPSLRAEATITADIVGLEPEADYYVAVRELTRQGAAPSPRLVKGPITTPQSVAGGVTHLGEETVDDFLTRMSGAVSDAASALASASAAMALIMAVPGQIDDAIADASTTIYAAISTAEDGLNHRIDTLGLADINGWSTWSGSVQTALDNRVTLSTFNGLAGQVAAIPRNYVQSSEPAGPRIVGDRWVDTTGGTNVPKTWNGSAWAVQVLPAGATTYAQGTAPTAPIVVGSVWYDTANGNRPHRWTGSAWAAIEDGRVAVLSGRIDSIDEVITDLPSLYASAASFSSLQSEVTAARGGTASLSARFTAVNQTITDGLALKASASALDALSAVVNGKPGVWVQSSAPGGTRIVGDLWIDTTGGNNVPKAWNGSAWVNQSIPAGITVYAQGTAPTAPIVTGSLWYDTSNDNRPHRWSGSAWVALADTRYTSLNARVVTLEDVVADLPNEYASASRVDLIESEITNARGGTASLSARFTAVNQTITDGLALKASASALDALSAVVNGKPGVWVQSSAPGGTRIVGDLWIDTTGGNNVPKAWNGSAWVNQAIPAGITVYAQGTAPTAPIVTGSLWYDTSNDNRPHRWSGSAWVALDDPRIVSLNGRVATLESVVADLPDEYASATRMDLVEAEIANARGGTASLTARFTQVNQAITDGLAGKASASDLSVLTAEVTTARNGSASLHAQLGTMRTATATLDSALSTTTSTLTAMIRVKGNEVRNSTGALGSANWTLGAGWTVTGDLQYGPRFETSGTGTSAVSQATNDYFPCIAGEWFTYQAELKRSGATGGGVHVRIAWYDGGKTLLGSTPYSPRLTLASAQDYGVVQSSETQAPAGAAFGRLQLFIESVSAAGLHGGRRMKVERGRLPATAWSDDATAVLTAAGVTQQAGAIATLQGRTTAYWTLNVAAGGNPAYIEARADGESSTVMMAASEFRLKNPVGGALIDALKITSGQAWFGGRVHFGTGAYIDPTLNAIVFDNGTTKKIYGMTFGFAGGLMEWFGPSSVANGSVTIANSYWAQAIDGQTYYGGAVLDPGAGGDWDIEVPGGRLGVVTGYNQISGSGWQDLSSVTLTSIAPGLPVSAVMTLGVPEVIGAAFVGEYRLVENSTVIDGPHAITFGNGEVIDPPMSPYGVSAASGTVTYKLQMRQTSGGYLNGSAGGQLAVSVVRSVTPTQPGMMTPAMLAALNNAAQLATSGTPAALGTAALGSSTFAARADHVHAHGNQAGGALHAVATTSVAGFMAAADKTKLDGISAGATVNSTDATLLNRANHTGAQAISTITGLQTALDGKYTNTGSLLSASGNALTVRSGSQGYLRFVGGGAGGQTGHIEFRNDATTRLAYIGYATATTFSFTGESTLTTFAFNKACTAPSFTPTCDAALKENIVVSQDDLLDLTAICQMGLVEYERVQDGVHARGILAQAAADMGRCWTVGGDPIEVAEGEEPPLDAVWDEDEQTWRTPLAVDLVAMIASTFGAIRQLANDVGMVEHRMTAIGLALAGFEPDDEAETPARLAAVEAALAALKAAVTIH